MSDEKLELIAGKTTFKNFDNGIYERLPVGAVFACCEAPAGVDSNYIYTYDPNYEVSCDVWYIKDDRYKSPWLSTRVAPR